MHKAKVMTTVASANTGGFRDGCAVTGEFATRGRSYRSGTREKRFDWSGEVGVVVKPMGKLMVEGAIGVNK